MSDHAVFSVASGTFHKPAAPFDRKMAWQPTVAACGRTVTPHNYFATVEDADRYLGGRFLQHLCRHCAKREG